MNWPDQPTCHGTTPATFIYDVPSWRGHAPMRTCSYCGSAHPEDLIRMLARGARLGGSDWKYGWPHKFYIYGGERLTKWYNVHLLDEGYDPEAWAYLTGLLAGQAGIHFSRDEKGVLYRAPYHGYQASGLQYADGEGEADA